MPSLTELRDKAEKLDKEVLQIRDEHAKLKAEGKTGDDAWGGAEKRARFRAVMDEREQCRQAMSDEEDEARLVALSEAERREQEQRERQGRQRPSGGLPGDRGDNGGDQRSREERSALVERQRDLALRAWSTRGLPGRSTSDEEIAACRALNFDVSSPSLALDLSPTRDHSRLQRLVRSQHPSLAMESAEHGELGRQTRALSAHDGSSGGFTIGSQLVRNLEINMLAFSGVEQAAEVILTDTGEEINWPSADDTTNEGEMLGEGNATLTNEDPAFKRQRWAAYEFSSKAVKVPRPLLEDSGVALDTLLPAMLAERVARSSNRKFTSGTGGNQPRGVVTAAELGRTTAAATVITGDDIIRLEHSVDPAYRNGSSAFMCHDSIMLEIAVLKSNDNQYLWRPGLADGQPDRLRGRPVIPNQHMDSALAASNKVLLYGDFSKYKIRRVRRVFVTRLVEKYAESNQVAFLLIVRQDGNLLNAGTCPIKYCQMHA